MNVNPSPTPYPALNAVLGDLVDRVRVLFGDRFIGAYLVGSFATGGFDAFSDVDFLVVLDGDVTEAQLPFLQALHGEVYALPSSWARHLEGSYIARKVLATLPPPQRQFWYLDHGARTVIRSDHDDTLVGYWTLREKGVVLAGPRPADLLPPIPADALRREIVTTMCAWCDDMLANPDKINNRFYQPFVVLSYCRMLHSLAVAAVDSKPAGAAWATEHLDPSWHDLIRRACEARPGDAAVKVREPAIPGDLKRTWPFIAYAIDFARRWKAA